MSNVDDKPSAAYAAVNSAWTHENFWPTEESTILYYDGPRLWTTVGPAGVLFAVVVVGEDESGRNVYLAVALSEQRRDEWLKGAVDCRDIFATAKEAVAVRTGPGKELSSWAVTDVPEDWLPLTGTFLGP